MNDNTNCFKFSDSILSSAENAMFKTKNIFEKIDTITEHNQQKVLKAFITEKVSSRHFAATDGYGYGDDGRDTLDRVYAKVFSTEDALVRHNFVNGTHALTTALFGVLRPGDTMLSVTGLPYDTMQSVIGLSKSFSGSLKDFGIQYKQVNLIDDQIIDTDKIKQYITSDVKVIYIQRSRGYSFKKSLSCHDIEKIIQITKSVSKNCIVLVDNCYGEFVETMEPTSVGADLAVGSLIKNPGGGIAPSGGYIVGRKDLIEMCANRLTTPGAGKEIGASLGHNKEMYLGFFNAPHVVGEALKSAVFAAAFMEELGFEALPKYNDPRYDIVQSVKLQNKENLITFCQGIQKGSPVDSFAKPEPWDMPGYDSKVIMAAGTFTLGASIELSADAPLREPFAVWLQGGLNFHSAKYSIMTAADQLIKEKNRKRRYL